MRKSQAGLLNGVSLAPTAARKHTEPENVRLKIFCPLANELLAYPTGGTKSATTIERFRQRHPGTKAGPQISSKYLRVDALRAKIRSSTIKWIDLNQADSG